MMQENKMKNGKGFKTLIGLSISAMLIFCWQAAVFAATPTNPEPVLTVNTALNAEAEDATDDAYPATDAAAPEPEWIWHPISVVNEPMNGFNAVRRTYALPPDINPAVIPTEDFEMFGQRFNFAYVLQQPTANESFMETRETVTMDAHSNDLNDILPNLEPEIWYERDGFAGTLSLDIHSVASEAAGTTRQTSTATRQRAYPHISAPDNALVPRTITDGGTTFQLAAVDWQSDSVSAVDGHWVASGYTANATYTAQVTQNRTTGYTVSAEYAGTVYRTAQGQTLFTAVFYGEPIIEVWLEEPDSEPVEETAEETETPEETLSVPVPRNGNGESNAVIIALAVIGTLIALAAVGAGGFFLAKHLSGYNVTVYRIDGPKEIVKAGKIKMEVNSPEPTIVLDKAVGHNPAKTDRYIVQIAQRAMPKLINKVVCVALHDKEAFHKVPEKALGVPVYEFDVNFSDDDDESAGTEVAAGTDGYIDEYPAGGDASNL